MYDDIIDAVDEQMPQFNKHLLLDFPKNKMDECSDVLSMAYVEAMRFLNNIVNYNGYTIMSPEERVAFELSTKRSGAPITYSELKLVQYKFNYEGHECLVHIYLPYLVDNQVIIRDTRYCLMYGITEKVFSRSNDSGITIRVIRQPLSFYRNIHFQLKSETSDYYSNEFIVTCKLHVRRSYRKTIETTITHYLLCKFGPRDIFVRFGIDPKDIYFVDKLDDDADDYEYFLARLLKPSEKDDPTIYLKVKKYILEDMTYRKLIANIIYLLSKLRSHRTVEDLHYQDPYDNGYLRFQTYLGELLYRSFSEAKDASQAKTHLHSVNFFLDPMTRKRISSFGVDVEDMWDLLQYAFIEIDNILVTSIHQNMYEKRIITTDLMMTNVFIAQLYRRVYNIDQHPTKLDKTKLNNIVKLGFNSIRQLSLKTENRDMIKGNIFNGNSLLSFGLKKNRLSGSKVTSGSLNSLDSRFDTSIAYVEQLHGLVGKSPASTGLINPYLIIDTDGGVQKQDYISEIDSLKPFLPY